MGKSGRNAMGIYPSTHKTLLEKIQNGDEVSWEEFYRRYSPVILLICAEHGIPEPDGCDILQNVMLKFFRDKLAMKYDPGKARFRTYFNLVLGSCISDFFRQKMRRSAEEPGEPIPEQELSPESDEAFLDEWRRQMLQEALDRLRNQVKPETFLAFHLTAFQGKSPRETAKFLKTDIDMVYVAKSRCAARLRKIILEINREDPELELNWKQPE